MTTLRGARWPVLAGLFLAVLASPAMAGSFTTDINFLIGAKDLDQDDWGRFDDPFAFGAEMSWGNTDWPVRIVSDVLIAVDVEDRFGIDEGLLVDDSFVVIVETLGGVRKIWEAGPVRPFLGGGVGFISAYVEEDNFFFDVDDDDTTFAAWVGGGVFWRLGDHFNIGFTARWSSGEVEIFGRDREAGGLQGGLLLGFGF